MTRRSVRILIFCALVILALILAVWVLYLSQAAAQPLLQAQNSYREAVNASTIIQRSQHLNKALSFYNSLDELYHPIHGNGKFYNNWAETFFQLEQYPWAALYFYQAKALRPRDDRVNDRLQNTLSKLNIAPASDESIFKKVFFFHYYLSLPERLQILTGITLAVLILSSLYLWKGYRFLKGVMAAFFLLWAFFFGSVIYTKYFEPLEGVIVKSSLLYPGSNALSTLVSSKPLLEGSKVEILDVVHEGQWLKIRTADGLLGFIPSDAIRLIRL